MRFCSCASYLFHSNNSTFPDLDAIMPTQYFLAFLLLAVTVQCVSADQKHPFAISVIDEATVGIVRGVDSNSFAAYSKHRKKWSTYSFPEHLTIQPSTLGEFAQHNKNDMVVAFTTSGGAVSELVAVDCRGRFRVHKLESALNRKLEPILNGDGVIYYIVDEVVYAFSGKTGTWDARHVPGLPEVSWIDGIGHAPSITQHGFDTESEEGIVIRRPDGVARFLADQGQWEFTPTKDLSVR